MGNSNQLTIENPNLQEVNLNNQAVGAKANVKGVSTVKSGGSNGKSALADTGSSSTESLEAMSPGEKLSSDPSFMRISSARKSHNAKLTSIAKKKRLSLKDDKSINDNGKEYWKKFLQKFHRQKHSSKSNLLTSLGYKNYGQIRTNSIERKKKNPEKKLKLRRQRISKQIKK